MTTPGPWTEAEFDRLLETPGLTNADLTAVLPGRTEGAVDAVRQAVHSWHTGGGFHTAGGLSQVQRTRLESWQGKGTCAVCRAPF